MITILITSQTCGHCTNLRRGGLIMTDVAAASIGGNQILGPASSGGGKYSYTSIKKILLAGKMKLIFYHLPDFGMNPPMDFSFIVLRNKNDGLVSLGDDQVIQQTLFKKRADGKTVVSNHFIGEKSRVDSPEIVVVDNEDNEVEWNKLTSSTFPIFQLRNNLNFFPCVMFVDDELFNFAKKDNTFSPLYSRFYGHDSDNDGKCLQTQNSDGDILSVISKYSSDRNFLLPPILREVTAPPVSVEKMKIDTIPPKIGFVGRRSRFIRI